MLMLPVRAVGKTSPRLCEGPIAAGSHMASPVPKLDALKISKEKYQLKFKNKKKKICFPDHLSMLS